MVPIPHRTLHALTSAEDEGGSLPSLAAPSHHSVHCLTLVLEVRRVGGRGLRVVPDGNPFQGALVATGRLPVVVWPLPVPTAINTVVYEQTPLEVAVDGGGTATAPSVASTTPASSAGACVCLRVNTVLRVQLRKWSMFGIFPSLCLCEGLGVGGMETTFLSTGSSLVGVEGGCWGTLLCWFLRLRAHSIITRALDSCEKYLRGGWSFACAAPPPHLPHPVPHPLIAWQARRPWC